MMELWNLSITEFHLLVSFFIFSVGCCGFLIKGNGLVALMCIELMLNGVNLALVSFGRLHNAMDSQVFFLFIVLVAAAEAAIALALFVGLIRRFKSIELDEVNQLRG